MNEAAITVENLSKKYDITHQVKGDGLRHAVEEALRSPLGWMRSRRQRRATAQEEFWALRGLDFEIKAGEVVGIIGRNGAGKSTLLKVLSRISDPTTGRIRMQGRVSSLLEVGTGFHPELTGRENIFLNGAILGMTRAEIVRKFDEIVAFAGIEKFLDTPVKRYSSGMYVRLAFAVAAHLEPEILIVDEVLAVGDAEFQKKCLEKMDHVGSSGRTVLFVSHNMQAVTRLCSRCILLSQGRVKLDGPSHQVAADYLDLGHGAHTQREWPDATTAPGDDVVRLRAVRLLSDEEATPGTFDIRRPIGVAIAYDILQPGHLFLPHFGLHDGQGTLLFIASDCDAQWRGRPRPPGHYISTGWIPGNFLAEGNYTVNANISTLDPEARRVAFRDAVAFRIVDDLLAPDTARGDYNLPMPGLLRPLLHWTNRYMPTDSDCMPGSVLNASDLR